MALLGELLVNVKSNSITFEVGLKKALTAADNFVSGLKKHKEAISEVGKAFGVASAGFAAALTLSVKSASEAQKVDARLTASLKNVVYGYDTASEALVKLASKMQDVTGYSDEDLKGAMTTLINMTGQYAVALKHTTTVADLARATNTDLNTAARLVGQAYLGNTSQLTRYGIVLTDGAKGLQALTELHTKFVGSSTAFTSTFAGQLSILKNSIDDLQENIGGVLLPVLTKYTEKLNGVVTGLKNMSAQNTEALAKFLIFGTTITGAVAGAAGLATALIKIKDALELAKVGVTAFYGVVIAHPFVAVTAAVAGLTLALGGLATKIWQNKIDEQSAGATLEGQIAIRQKQIDKIIEEGQARKKYSDEDAKTIEKLRSEITYIQKVIDLKKKEKTARQEAIISKGHEKTAIELLITELKKELTETQNLKTQITTYTSAVVTGYDSMTAAVIENNRLTSVELKAGLKDMLNAVLTYFMTQLSGQLAVYSAMLFNPLTAASAASGIAGTLVQMGIVEGLKVGVAYLAEGGIVNSPTLAMIGEGSDPEAVIPLPELTNIVKEAVSNTNNTSFVLNVTGSIKDVNWDALIKQQIQPALERNARMSGG
jgi:hypothetical protein